MCEERNGREFRTPYARGRKAVCGFSLFLFNLFGVVLGLTIAWGLRGHVEGSLGSDDLGALVLSWYPLWYPLVPPLSGPISGQVACVDPGS